MGTTAVVGVGNIYACEALFRARVHPNRSVARISRQRWDRLAEAGVAVLEQAIAEGGTALNDFQNGAGESGDPAAALGELIAEVAAQAGGGAATSEVTGRRRSSRAR